MRARGLYDKFGNGYEADYNDVLVKFQLSGLNPEAEIPVSMTSIGDHAFSGCSGLTTIVIPDSVTSIGNNAFSGCSALTEIMIPEGVSSIGRDAFYGCSGLTSVVIPNSVRSI
jgi:hypothetical protein